MRVKRRFRNAIFRSRVGLAAVLIGFSVQPTSADGDFDRNAAQLAQSSAAIVYFRTADLKIGFAPDTFSFFAFEEYRKFGVRNAAINMQEWSGVKVLEANASPNMIVLRERGFSSIIQSDDLIVRSVLEQFFGGEKYPENIRKLVGKEEDCFFINVTTPDGRIHASILMMNSRLRVRDEAICFVRGWLARSG